MIPHFILQKGKQEYLIIRMGDDFHIIDCNEALTKEKRFAVLESGCTPAGMQEMGLSGMTIPKSGIKALTITGCGFQDDVIFYLSKQKLSFWFPQAYEQKKVDDFFRGIPRRMVKTRRRLKGGRDLDWRLKEQDDATYQRLRPVGWVFNLLCAVVCIYPFVIQRLPMKLHGWLVLGLCLTAVALDIFFPEYFSLILVDRHSVTKKRRKGGTRYLKTRAIRLSIGLMPVVGFFALLCTLDYHMVDWLRVLPPSLILTAVVYALLFLFCREFQEHLVEGLFCMVFALILNFGGLVPYVNHCLGPELTPITAPIVDQHISGGRTTSHYCTVALPDGRELDVLVTGAEYDSYEIGDTMDLRFGTGFFGIEYAIDG